MKYFITGGAGFIGSNMADRLLSEPENEVVVYDNFSTGRREFLELALKNDRFRLVEGDTLDLPALTDAMKGCEMVFHFASFGIAIVENRTSRIDKRNTQIATCKLR